MTDIENLLIKLIKIPSVSGEENNISKFIIRQLRGFKIKKQLVDGSRYNIIATKGKSKKWLVAHIDTVPGEVSLLITEDRICGRGACDNKQSVAASIIVGNKLEDINLLFTVGEESDFIGAKTAQKANIKGDLVVVQEPTDFKVITGQRGIIVFTIRTKGIKQHSGIDKINSATHELIDILSSLKKNRWTSFNIGKIQGGIADNVVANSAQAEISIRPRDIKEYRDILAKLKNIKNEVIIRDNFKPYVSNFKFTPLTSKYFTEMVFFKNSIQYGAGDWRVAHSDKEYISRKDLNLLPKKLIGLLASVLE